MINLLPPQEKKELLAEEKFKLVLILETLFLIFLISLILILFSVNTYILGWVQSQKVLVGLEEEEFKSPKVQEFQEKITLINQNLTKMNSFYQKQAHLVGIFEKISNIMPSGIYLTSISYQKDSSQLNLSGYSPDRETLFDFKQNLERAEGFKDIYFPPSNWVKPTDIEFYVTFKAIF